MTFASLIWKNVWRRPARSLLTVAGVGIGVAGGFSLCAIAWGLELGWQLTYAARGTDIIVIRGDGSGLLPPDFSLPAKEDFLAIKGVSQTASVLSDIMEIETFPHMLVYGWEPGSYLWEHLSVHKPDPDCDSKGALLGVVAAEMLGKAAGDILHFEGRDVPVRAVFRSSALVENSAVILPLPLAQELLDREGKVNCLNLRLDPGMAPEASARVRAVIENKWPDLRAFPAADLAKKNSGIQAAKAMSLATALVAMVVASLGMTNALLAGVLGRTREIGILLAVGWSRLRIVLMVLLESLCLSLTGAVAGICAGAIGVRLLQHAEVFGGKMEADFSPVLFLAAILAGAGLGAVCGIVPALCAGSLRPTAALNRGRAL